MGRTTRYIVKITNPKLIPAQWLLPMEQNLYDPESYPRIRAAVRAQGKQISIPGIEVIPDPKLTQR
jgi:hypothetical protein